MYRRTPIFNHDTLQNSRLTRSNYLPKCSITFIIHTIIYESDAIVSNLILDTIWIHHSVIEKCFSPEEILKIILIGICYFAKWIADLMKTIVNKLFWYFTRAFQRSSYTHIQVDLAFASMRPREIFQHTLQRFQTRPGHPMLEFAQFS